MMKIRDARPADARLLAYLVNLAGEGLPAYLWRRSTRPGESPFDIGRRRALRPYGGFSYRNARICAERGRDLGMAVCYRLPPAPDGADPEACDAVLRPLLLLEAKAPGSWYINALATVPEYRGRGVARLLMNDALERGVANDCDRASLIVASENRAALRLYEKLGFQVEAALPVVGYPGCARGGDWLLMTVCAGVTLWRGPLAILH